MMCRRCKTDIGWPDSLSSEERYALLRLSYESRAQAQVHLVKDHGFAMVKAKEIVSHLALARHGCSRPGCSGQVIGAIAACAKCGAVTLGEPTA
jgi:hypothetical protein